MHTISTTVRGTYCDKSVAITCDVHLVRDQLIVDDVDLVELQYVDDSGKCTVVPLCPDDGTRRERLHYKAVAQEILDFDPVQYGRITLEVNQDRHAEACISRKAA